MPALTSIVYSAYTSSWFSIISRLSLNSVTCSICTEWRDSLSLREPRLQRNRTFSKWSVCNGHNTVFFHLYLCLNKIMTATVLWFQITAMTGQNILIIIDSLCVFLFPCFKTKTLDKRPPRIPFIWTLS